MRQMALLNLDIEPSADWLEEFEKSEHQHQDSQEQRQGPAEATGHFSFLTFDCSSFDQDRQVCPKHIDSIDRLVCLVSI